MLVLFHADLKDVVKESTTVVASSVDEDAVTSSNVVAVVPEHARGARNAEQSVNEGSGCSNGITTNGSSNQKNTDV